MKPETLLSISVVAMLAILFTPQGSEIWKFFLFLGAVFGGLWLIKK